MESGLPLGFIKRMVLAGCWLFFTGVGCGQTPHENDSKHTSPEGYDLNNPEVFDMDSDLEEISGISFLYGNADTLFAQQDEEGKLFFFAPGDKKPKHVRFGKDGDYEDIALSGDQVVMLRSDGSLYRFAVAERHGKRVEAVETWKKPLPKGEYESLATRDGDSLIYVLCKACEVDRKREETTGYGVRLLGDGDISLERSFSVNSDEIERFAPLKGKPFRPSAMTWNRYTEEWYVISSINKLLVILDSQWHVKAAHRLDPKRYIQPEGLAIDNNRALYIASERGEKGKRATVYKFTFDGR